MYFYGISVVLDYGKWFAASFPEAAGGDGKYYPFFLEQMFAIKMEVCYNTKAGCILSFLSFSLRKILIYSGF